jgi:hypothetical protein
VGALSRRLSESRIELRHPQGKEGLRADPRLIEFALGKRAQPSFGRRTFAKRSPAKVPLVRSRSWGANSEGSVGPGAARVAPLGRRLLDGRGDAERGSRG